MFERALADYQKILNDLSGNQSTDYRTIPEVQKENPYFKRIIAANFNKGDAFLAWFGNGGDIDHLEDLPLKITARHTVK